MNAPAYVPTDTPWHLISLRPQGQHDALRRAAARFGARTVALSPWQLRLRTDAATRAQLALALGCDRIVFTSPAAADAAARLLPLEQIPAGRAVTVGEGTARELRRRGVVDVQAPSRMDSEGLLALPAMHNLQGKRVALITAPGGRGMIAAQVQAMGAQLLRVDVYDRVLLPVSAASVARLQALEGPAVLALSSGEALEHIVAQLPESLLQRWRAAPVVGASARLAQLATSHGFEQVHVAAGPMPAQLASAAYAMLHPQEPSL